MQKNKKEPHTTSKVIETKLQKKFVQLTITIPKKDWETFPVGSRTKIHSKKGIHIVRKVGSIGRGKQRIVTIPACDNDLFKKGDEIKIYPYKTKLRCTNEQKKEINKQTRKEESSWQNNLFLIKKIPLGTVQDPNVAIQKRIR